MIVDLPVILFGFVNVCFIYFDVVLLIAYSFRNICIFYHKLPMALYFFPFQHPVLQLPWPFLLGQRAGHWHEPNTGE